MSWRRDIEANHTVTLLGKSLAVAEFQAFGAMRSARQIPACGNRTKPKEAGETQAIPWCHCRLRAAMIGNLR
jgi:hypothetical protein